MAKKALQERIALVAGATRGAGRGIAIALGEAGATVKQRDRGLVCGYGDCRFTAAGGAVGR